MANGRQSNFFTSMSYIVIISTSFFHQIQATMNTAPRDETSHETVVTSTPEFHIVPTNSQTSPSSVQDTQTLPYDVISDGNNDVKINTEIDDIIEENRRPEVNLNHEPAKQTKRASNLMDHKVKNLFKRQIFPKYVNKPYSRNLDLIPPKFDERFNAGLRRTKFKSRGISQGQENSEQGRTFQEAEPYGSDASTSNDLGSRNGQISLPLDLSSEYVDGEFPLSFVSRILDSFELSMYNTFTQQFGKHIRSREDDIITVTPHVTLNANSFSDLRPERGQLIGVQDPSATEKTLSINNDLAYNMQQNDPAEKPNTITVDLFDGNDRESENPDLGSLGQRHEKQPNIERTKEEFRKKRLTQTTTQSLKLPANFNRRSTQKTRRSAEDTKDDIKLKIQNAKLDWTPTETHSVSFSPQSDTEYNDILPDGWNYADETQQFGATFSFMINSHKTGLFNADGGPTSERVKLPRRVEKSRIRQSGEMKQLHGVRLPSMLTFSQARSDQDKMSRPRISEQNLRPRNLSIALTSSLNKNRKTMGKNEKSSVQNLLKTVPGHSNERLQWQSSQRPGYLRYGNGETFKAAIGDFDGSKPHKGNKRCLSCIVLRQLRELSKWKGPRLRLQNYVKNYKDTTAYTIGMKNKMYFSGWLLDNLHFLSENKTRQPGLKPYHQRVHRADSSFRTKESQLVHEKLKRQKRSERSMNYDYVLTANMAILLPVEQDRLFSMRRVVGAVKIALERVEDEEILPGVQLKAEMAESHCSISDAMNAAIEFYARKAVNVFLGPVCDYAVAPVARQVRYWRLPLITPGAMAGDFGIGKQSMFPLLTRIGSNNNMLVEFLMAMLQYFNWHKVKVIYRPDGFMDIMDRFCHIAADTIVQGLRINYANTNITEEHHSFHNLAAILAGLGKAIGNDHAKITYTSRVLASCYESSTRVRFKVEHPLPTWQEELLKKFEGGV